MLRLGVLIGLLILVGCSSGETTGVQPRKIIYGLTLSPSGFDPHRNESSELGIPMRQVYDTLVYRNPEDGSFVPGLATNWTISDDRLTYTFNLREDVKFHDGTEFNALAVATTLDRIKNPETRSTKALALLGSYANYQINDEYSITLILSEPYSALLDSLSQVYLGIASPTALAQYTPERYQFHQVGTGPYKLVEFVPDTKLILKRNYEYNWGPAFYQTAQEGEIIDEIEYRFFTDAATRFSGLESGGAQIMGEVPPLTARSLTGNSQFSLIPSAIAGQPLQFLINTQQPPTDNLTFRQVLLYGTNRTAISDVVYQGFSPVAWGPITSNTQFYNRDMNGLYDYDASRAIDMLASLGYTDSDNNGFLDNPAGGDLEVSMIMPPWSAVPQVAQLMQDQWRELGIKLTLVPVPDFPTLLSQVQEGQYNLVAFNTYGVDPAFLNSFYTTGGSRNWTGFSSPELDSILFDAARQLEPGTRVVLYGRAQRIIMDNALIIPIRETVNLNATTNNIQNLTFDPYGWFPLLANVRWVNP